MHLKYVAIVVLGKKHKNVLTTVFLEGVVRDTGDVVTVIETGSEIITKHPAFALF